VGKKDGREGKGHGMSESVRLACQGVSTVAMAMGLAGSGTTHTVQGTEVHPGLIPRCLTHLFEDLDEAGRRKDGYRSVVRISFVQVSNETVFDLLTPAEMLEEEGMLTELPWREALVWNEETRGVDFVGVKAVRVEQAYGALEQWGEGCINMYLTMQEPDKCSSVFRVYVDTYRFGEARPCRSATVDIVDCAAPDVLGDDGRQCNVAVRDLCDEVNAFRGSPDGHSLPEGVVRGQRPLSFMMRPCLGGASVLQGFVCMDAAEKDGDGLGYMVEFAENLRRIVNRPVRMYGVRELKPESLNPAIAEVIREIEEEGPLPAEGEGKSNGGGASTGAEDELQDEDRAGRARNKWKAGIQNVVSDVRLRPEVQLKRMRSSLLWTTVLLRTERAKVRRLEAELEKRAKEVRGTGVATGVDAAAIEARIVLALAHAEALSRLEDGSGAKEEAVSMLARLHAVGAEGGESREEAEQEVAAIWKEVRALQGEVEQTAAALAHEAEVRELKEEHARELRSVKEQAVIKLLRLKKMDMDEARQLQEEHEEELRRLRGDWDADAARAAEEEAAAGEAEKDVERARMNLELARKKSSSGVRRVAAARARSAEAEAELQRLRNELDAVNSSHAGGLDGEDAAAVSEAERVAESVEGEVRQLEEDIKAARARGDQSASDRRALAEERALAASAELQSLREALDAMEGGPSAGDGLREAEAEASALEAERDRVQRELADARASAERDEGVRVAAAKLRAEAARKRAEAMRAELASLELESKGSGGGAREAEAMAEQAEADALEVGRRLAETASGVEGDRARTASAQRRASDASQRRASSGQALEGALRDLEGASAEASKGADQLRKALERIEYLQQALLRREKRILALEDLLRNSIEALREKEDEADALKEEVGALADSLEAAEEEIQEQARAQEQERAAAQQQWQHGARPAGPLGYATLHASGTHLQHLGSDPMRRPGSQSPTAAGSPSPHRTTGTTGPLRWSPPVPARATSSSPAGSVGSAGDQKPPWQSTHDLSRPRSLKSGLLPTIDHRTFED